MNLDILITIQPGPLAAQRLNASLQTLAAQIKPPRVFLLETGTNLLTERVQYSGLELIRLDCQGMTQAEALDSHLTDPDGTHVLILKAGDGLAPHTATVVEDLLQQNPEMNLLAIGTSHFDAGLRRMKGSRQLLGESSAQLLHANARRWGLAMASQKGIGPKLEETLPAVYWPSGQVCSLALLRRTAAVQGGLFLPPAWEQGLLGCYFNTKDAWYLDLPMVIRGDWSDPSDAPEKQQRTNRAENAILHSPLKAHTEINDVVETHLKVLRLNQGISQPEDSLRLEFFLSQIEQVVRDQPWTDESECDLQEAITAAAAALTRRDGGDPQAARQAVQAFTAEARKKAGSIETDSGAAGIFGSLADFANWMDASFILPKIASIKPADHSSIFREQARTALKSGAAREAEQALREVILRQPQDAEAMAAIARICFDSDRWEEAFGFWYKLVKSNRMPPEGWLDLAETAWQLGDRPTLELALGEAGRLIPGHPRLAEMRDRLNALSPATRHKVVGVWNAYADLNTNNRLMTLPNAGIGDDLLKPVNMLYQMGLKRGWILLSLDLLPDIQQADAFLFFDKPDENHDWVKQAFNSGKPCVLIINETEMILPEGWQREKHAGYQRIFTWNNDWADGKKYIQFYQAQDLPRGLTINLAQKEKLCTLIASNKSVDHPFELYSHRLAAIRWFECHHPDDFDLYGHGWNKALFPSYRGTLESKKETLARYRFAICYENTFAYPGYITEKLFDCLKAGCVPIYWGAPNVTDVVPADCIIDRRRFASMEDLYALMDGMSDEEYCGYLERISAFLAGPETDRFRCEHFTDQVLDVLQELLAKDRSTVSEQKNLPVEAEHFKRIVESPDVMAALAEHPNWLDDSLVTFITGLAATAHREKQGDLEKMLNQLISAIRSQMAGQDKSDSEKNRKNRKHGHGKK
jgi:tetratricopeptide (TPR) repeat protein